MKRPHKGDRYPGLNEKFCIRRNKQLEQIRIEVRVVCK